MLGLYDSGVGGFSIYQAIKKILPDTKTNYFADTKILPLGDKNSEFITNRVVQACDFMFNNYTDIVILACNTATVNSIRYIQEKWLPKFYPDKKVLGISKPLTELLEEKFNKYRFEKNLILATNSTNKSNFYQDEFKKVGFTNFTTLDGRNLANLIENQEFIEVEILIKELQESINFQPKLVLLACTHYPIVKNLIEKYFTGSIVVDPSFWTAEKLKLYSQHHPEFFNNNRKPIFWTSGDTAKFNQKVWDLFQIKIDSCSASLSDT